MTLATAEERQSSEIRQNTYSRDCELMRQLIKQLRVATSKRLRLASAGVRLTFRVCH